MRHHDQLLAAFVRRQESLRDTVGVVLVGSVARGDERPDSDVDVYLVLTHDAYRAAREADRVAYVDRRDVSYDGGYVDVKLASVAYLEAAADHGDEPTRASFDRACVVMDRVGDLGRMITQISVIPEVDWARRAYHYRAQLALYGQYFLPQAERSGDAFLRQHSAVHAGLAAGRCALAVDHRFFRGQKYLSGDLHGLSNLPDGFLDAWDELASEGSTGAAQRLVELTDAWLGNSLTVDESLSAFIAANELSWLEHTTPPEFW